MKQELTIAVCLLAAGVTIVSWQSADRSSDRARPVESSAAINASSAEGLPRDSYSLAEEPATIQQAGYFAPVAPLPPIAISLGRPKPLSDFRSDGSTADRADLMLRRARHMIDDGPAFESHVAARATLFGQTVIGSGVYLQTGQGEGKTRTTLAFHSVPADRTTDDISTPPQQQVTNLCDGRFVYRLYEDLIEKEQTLEFYDLQQIKNSKLRHKESSETRRPGIPLAPGELISSGMAGLLQHLADEFRFAIVDESNGPSGTTRLLRGVWHPNRLQNLLRDHLSTDQLKAGLAWSKLPPNLPHAVEVTLVRVSAWELFPSQLTFYQFQKNDDRTIAQPIVSIQFQRPGTVTGVSDDQFVLHSENLEATDLTQQYLSKLRPDEDSTLR